MKLQIVRKRTQRTGHPLQFLQGVFHAALDRRIGIDDVAVEAFERCLGPGQCAANVGKRLLGFRAQLGNDAARSLEGGRQVLADLVERHLVELADDFRDLRLDLAQRSRDRRQIDRTVDHGDLGR